MTDETCILTTKDFTILEIMRDRLHDDAVATILERKLKSAVVVFRDDVPENVATLSSRVSFSIDGHRPDTRIISHERMDTLPGMLLPISTPRGLALLGLAEGQELIVAARHGGTERVRLATVHYQPEAARRRRNRSGDAEASVQRPMLRMIRGGRHEPFAIGTGDHDDPGPSAA